MLSSIWATHSNSRCNELLLWTTKCYPLLAQLISESKTYGTNLNQHLNLVHPLYTYLAQYVITEWFCVKLFQPILFSPTVTIFSLTHRFWRGVAPSGIATWHLVVQILAKNLFGIPTFFYTNATCRQTKNRRDRFVSLCYVLQAGAMRCKFHYAWTALIVFQWKFLNPPLLMWCHPVANKVVCK